eukprot:5203448-Lingulodinium_polyedra.AAC.1
MPDGTINPEFQRLSAEQSGSMFHDDGRRVYASRSERAIVDCALPVLWGVRAENEIIPAGVCRPLPPVYLT